MDNDEATKSEPEPKPGMNMGHKGPATLRTLSPFIAGVLLVIIFIISMISIYDNGRIIIDIPNMTGGGVVKGTVTDRNDTGLEDAMIGVKSTDIFVQSDINGNFSIENCPQGIQTITFYKRGFAPRDIDVLVTASGYEFPPITLVETKLVGNTSVLGTVNLTGQVTNETFEPLANITLSLTPGDLTARTANDGTYRFTAIKVGIYNLSLTFEFANTTNVTYRLFISNTSTAFDVHVDNLTALADHTIDMVPRFRLSGVITNADGEPLENISVRLTSEVEGIEEGVRTSLDGRYTFERIPGGVYNLSATKAGYQLRYFGNFVLDTNQTSSFQLEKGKYYSEDWVFLQQWIICVVITSIFAVFGLLGAILAFRRRNYTIAVICALLGALSAGPFCSLNLILGLLAFGMILMARNQFS